MRDIFFDDYWGAYMVFYNTTDQCFLMFVTFLEAVPKLQEELGIGSFFSLPEEAYNKMKLLEGPYGPVIAKTWWEKNKLKFLGYV